MSRPSNTPVTNANWVGIGWFEHAESGLACCNGNARQLWVEVHFFHVVAPVVDEQQLRGDIGAATAQQTHTKC